MLFRRHTSALLVLGVLCLFGLNPAQGQEEERPEALPTEGVEPPTDSILREEPEDETFADTLYAIENWELGYGLELTRMYDDNVFAQDNDTTSDWLTIVSPEMSLESDWNRHALNISGGMEIGRFDEETDESYIDAYGSIGGHLDLLKDHQLFGSFSGAREHESRTNPDFPGGADEPVVYHDFNTVLGLDHRLEPFRLRHGFTGRRLDFEDVSRILPGELNNDDRDRNIFDFGGRLTYIRGQVFHPFVQASYNSRQYDDEADDFGFHRDSQGYRAAAGTQVRLGRNAFGEVFAGYMGQDYDDPRFDTVHGLKTGVRVNAALTGRTRVDFSLDRSIEETTLPGSSASVETTAIGELRHHLTSDLTVSVPAYLHRSEFKEIGRTDYIPGIGVNLNYQLLPSLYFEVGYNREQRESSLETAEYDSDTLYISVGTSNLDSEPPKLASEGDNIIGLYAGAQGGVNTLITETTGPRGSGGSVETNQGDLGAVGGGFLGASTMIDRWQVAAELDLDYSSARWDHGGSVERNFYSERDRSAGAALRLGYLVNEASVLYGRLGLVNTKFENYLNNDGAITHNTRTETGLQYGTGIEVGLDSDWLARMDWTHNSYGDYSVANENYDPDVSVVRFGLAYRFGGGPDEETSQAAAVEHDFTGIYHTIDLGHSSLMSLNTGQGRGHTGDNTLINDRAGDGWNAGLTTGVGGRILPNLPLYVGVEAVGELSTAKWNIARTPDRRIYSLDKEYAYGGLLRLGYLIENTALFYVKGGPMRARFDLDYEFQNATGGPINIDREFNELGVRYGGGIEVPVSDSMFVRLEYTYTDYGSESFDIASGDEHFDTNESLVQFGVGFRY